MRVLCFAASIAVISAVLIGLVPALEATAGNVSDHIKDGQHARQPRERRRFFPRVLLASEVALALLLVVGAGLLATSLVRLFKSGLGFDPKGLVNIAFRMDKQQLEGDALMRQYQQLGEGLSRQPGVKKVSFEFIVPLSHRGWNGRYGAPGAQPQLIYMNSVVRITSRPCAFRFTREGNSLGRHQGFRAQDDPEPIRSEAALSGRGSVGSPGDRGEVADRLPGGRGCGRHQVP